MSNYKNILVAIDVNAPHESIIRKALAVCQSSEDLILMYTLLPTTYIQPYIYPMEFNAIDDSERMSLAHKKLSDIAKEDKRNGQ
jgi:universal stress protein A